MRQAVNRTVILCGGKCKLRLELLAGITADGMTNYFRPVYFVDVPTGSRSIIYQIESTKWELKYEKSDKLNSLPGVVMSD